MNLKCLIPLRNAVAALAATILVAGPADAAPLTFAGTGTGNIPDPSSGCGGAGTPLVISFNVNSMGAPLTDLRRWLERA